MIDWVFTLTFKIRILNEKRNRKNPKTKIWLENPIPIKEMARKIQENKMGILLLNLDIKKEENGNPNKELMGNINNKLPNCASFKFKDAFMVGILDAQEANKKPERKKNTFKNTRFFFRELMFYKSPNIPN